MNKSVWVTQHGDPLYWRKAGACWELATGPECTNHTLSITQRTREGCEKLAVK